MDYETVIGLEVHVQLLTKSKLFCGCPNKFSHDPNTQVCPVCLGLPGVLPVLNLEAFEKSLTTAIALGCAISPLTKFDRKHYYYPDLPKNIQISQYDLPFSHDGHLDVEVEGQMRRIGITRVHLEEDAGKLIHGAGGSSVDLNRTGTPLMEVVSEPDIRTPAEAREYLILLHQTLRYLGVSDCNMQEGSLRCDANVSIRPRGESKLGVKNEIKNMNSFKGVEQALELVREELIAMADRGDAIKQVTWGYSIEKGQIFKMRTKEQANDYRYFPEPDLPPVRVDEAWIARAKARVGELPRAKRDRFVSQYGLSAYDAGVLTDDKALAEYYEAVAQACSKPKEAANWVINDVCREMNERGLAIHTFPVKAEALAELVALVEGKAINLPTARKVFAKLIELGGGSPKEIVEREGLAQVSDTGLIDKLLEEAIAANPKAVADIAAGKTATAGFFTGAIMKALKGQGDPAAVNEAIAKRFNIDPALLVKKKK